MNRQDATTEGRRPLRFIGGAVPPWRAICLVLAACGYHTVYAGDRAARLHVKLVRTFVPDAIASDEVASGVREELAREGALEPGDGWPRVEIEVLRADETSEGIAARPGGPVARGTEVAVIARAWVSLAAGATPRHDTGDMRAAVLAGIDESLGVPDPLASGFHYDDALRAAARRVGHKLARKLLGEPAASEDSIAR